MIDDATKAAYEQHRDLAKRQFPSSCYAPFTSLYFNTNGDVIACCKNTSYVLGNVTRERLDDIWRGKRIQALRKALTGYNFKLGCEFCEWQIQGGGFDQVYTKTFDELPLRGEEPEWPSMLEFTLSNTCNLACVMCYGVLSSTIRSQRENLPPLPKVYDDRFFEDLRRYLPHLKIAKFFGGEPFLAQESYRVWDMMIEDGISIPCHVTTNGTQWNAKVERVLEHFPVSLSISVDGATKETAESIRVNMDFETVTRNVERFLDYTRKRGTYMSLTYCLMRQNWHEFGEYLRYGEKLGVDVFINTVIDPADCSLYTLPPAELAAIVQKMEALDAEHGFAELARNGAQWTSALDALRKNANERQKAGIDSVKEANQKRSLIARIWKLIEDGDLARALEQARGVADDDSRKYEARIAESRALCDLGRLDEAEQVLDEAIGAWRKSPTAFLVRAAVRLRRDRPAEARSDLEHALSGPPPAAQSWLAVLPHVWSLIDSGLPQHAIVLLDAMPDEIAHGREASLARARALRRLGRDDDAETALGAMLDRDPNATVAYVERAWIRLDRDDAAGVREDARSASLAVEVDGEARPAVLHLLAYSGFRDGRFDEALEHVDALVGLMPREPFQLLRAEILAKVGRQDEALAVVRDVLERSPGHGEALTLQQSLQAG
jgi:radical SAM protein with 4Fe4S-binding SPASM domain